MSPPCLSDAWKVKWDVDPHGYSETIVDVTRKHILAAQPAEPNSVSIVWRLYAWSCRMHCGTCTLAHRYPPITRRAGTSC